MTKVTGIIAEFNPFHNGHKRLLDAAGRDSVKVVAMSGNWMQRGEPAMLDKWTRAAMALANGADVVVELPVMTSLQGADFFATGAVGILSRLGVDEILFGTEDGETDYQRLSTLYAVKRDEMAAYMAGLPELMSYPLKAQKAWEAVCGVTFDGNTPNHILGLAYAKAASGTGIGLRTLQRQTDYNSVATVGDFASATAIRADLAASQRFVPENVRAQLATAPKTSWQDFWPLLRYKIISASRLTDLYQVNDELAHRITKSVATSTDLLELVERVYTKRYTKGYIRRVLTYILLDIPRGYQLPERLHVLGFTRRGQAQLATARGQLTTRIGQHPWDPLTQRADAIYRLGNPDIPEQTFARKPILFDTKITS